MAKSSKSNSTESQRYRDYWYELYRVGLQYYGIELKKLKKPSAKSIEKAQKYWKQIRKDLSKEVDEVPTIREAYNLMIEQMKSETDFRETDRDEEMQTEPAKNMYDADLDVITQFLARIERIYQDTFTTLDRQRENKSSILPHVVDINRLSASHSNLVEFVNGMINDVGENYKYVAQALIESNELQYIEAVALIPPSSVKYEFEETLEHLQSVWNSALTKAQAEAEKEAYY